MHDREPNIPPTVYAAITVPRTLRVGKMSLTAGYSPWMVEFSCCCTPKAIGMVLELDSITQVEFISHITYLAEFCDYIPYMILHSGPLIALRVLCATYWSFFWHFVLHTPALSFLSAQNGRKQSDRFLLASTDLNVWSYRNFFAKYHSKHMETFSYPIVLRHCRERSLPIYRFRLCQIPIVSKFV